MGFLSTRVECANSASVFAKLAPMLLTVTLLLKDWCSTMTNILCLVEKDAKAVIHSIPKSVRSVSPGTIWLAQSAADVRKAV